MKKLSEKTNIDQNSISRYNTGRVLIPLDKLKIIADALECEIVELLPVGEKFGHWELDGDWLGIIKKERK